MGLTVISSVIVGFRVSHKDFWTENKVPSPACPLGHARKEDQTFCPTCGERFGTEYQRVFKDRFRNLCQMLNLDAQALEKTFENYNSKTLWYEGIADHSSGSDDARFEVLDASGYCLDEDNDPMYVVGTQLIERGLSRADTSIPNPGFSLDALQGYFTRVRELAADFDLEDREIRLYDHMYVGC